MIKPKAMSHTHNIKATVTLPSLKRGEIYPNAVIIRLRNRRITIKEIEPEGFMVEFVRFIPKEERALITEGLVRGCLVTVIHLSREAMEGLMVGYVALQENKESPKSS